MNGSNTSFNMPLAIRNGYRFVGREWSYLARFCLLPVGFAITTDLIAYYQRPTTVSFFEDFIWGIPALAFYGWVMFLEIRLLLLGERVPQISPEPDDVMERRRALSASVLVWILFNMAAIAIYAYMDWGKGKSNPVVNFFWLFLVGAGVWGVRFAVVYILAAVGYPIRRYIFQVNGIIISLRLGALYILTWLPIWLVQMVLITMALPEDVRASITDPTKAVNLPESSAVAIIILQAVGNLVVDVLTTATFCYALKDMLSNPRQEKTV